MGPDKHTLTQTRDAAVAKGHGRLQQGSRGRKVGGRGARIGVSLVLALFLAVTPAQTRLAHAALDSTDTATGTGALNFAQNNASYTGSGNTADGFQALYSDSAGFGNTADGSSTLSSNQTGVFNTAAGAGALEFNTMGSDNTAAGVNALELSGGDHNTAVGVDALEFNGSGNNTALGFKAGVTANAANANMFGSDNTYLGYDAGPGTSSEVENATAIGAGALVSEKNALVLGGTGFNAVSVGIGTASPAYTLDVQGTVRATGLITGDVSGNAGTVTNGVYTTGSYSDPSWISSLAGSKISGNISGSAAGFTGTLSGDVTGTQGATTISNLQGLPLDLSTAPTSNQLLLFNGSRWVASNLPGGSGYYIQNGTSQQASANFNISGNGTLGGTLTVAGTGSSTVVGSLGVGTSSPHSLLQVGVPSTSYGSYLQLPVVTISTTPPVSDCNPTTFVGRMVLQYDSTKVRTTLWSCSAAGVWTRLAQGG